MLIPLVASLVFGVAVVIATYFGLMHLQDESGAAPIVGTSMRRGDMRQRALRDSFLFRISLPLILNLSAALRPLNLRVLRNYVGGPYAQAGYPGGLENDDVVALGMLVAFVLTIVSGGTITVLLGPLWAWTGMLGIPVGFLLVVSSLRSRAAAREVLIMQAMPYMLDLIVLLLRAGTSLRIALARVVDDYREHPIGEEFGQVLAEIDVGSSRPEAFKRLSDRLKIQDLTSLTDAIVQSEELGWPLADTLERLADRLSSERVLRAQSRAGAAGVLVMIPSTLVLAAALLLLFGPFIVRLMINGVSIQ
jgi:tight adherence protein C